MAHACIASNAVTLVDDERQRPPLVVALASFNAGIPAARGSRRRRLALDVCLGHGLQPRIGWGRDRPRPLKRIADYTRHNARY